MLLRLSFALYRRRPVLAQVQEKSDAYAKVAENSGEFRSCRRNCDVLALRGWDCNMVRVISAPL